VFGRQRCSQARLGPVPDPEAGAARPRSERGLRVLFVVFVRIKRKSLCSGLCLWSTTFEAWLVLFSLGRVLTGSRFLFAALFAFALLFYLDFLALKFGTSQSRDSLAVVVKWSTPRFLRRYPLA
jgi:hypothetical protein